MGVLQRLARLGALNQPFGDGHCRSVPGTVAQVAHAIVVRADARDCADASDLLMRWDSVPLRSATPSTCPCICVESVRE